MECKHTPRDFDQQIQIQLDVVTEILAASVQNQVTVEAALVALKQMQRDIEHNLRTLTKDVRAKIESSADATATETAALLQEKFVKADQHASAAADRYEHAGQWLGLKLFMMLILVLGTVLGRR